MFAAHAASTTIAGRHGSVRGNAAAATTQDWPTYLHDTARTSASGDTTLTPANVQFLQEKFAAVTGGVIAAEPAIVNGIAYVGSWDGYEYAINANTGAVIWKTFLGTITDPPCAPPKAGITSSATIYNGVVYVGGGNDPNGEAQWYALSAATGAILWNVPTGLGPVAGPYYNWSSSADHHRPGRRAPVCVYRHRQRLRRAARPRPAPQGLTRRPIRSSGSSRWFLAARSAAASGRRQLTTRTTNKIFVSTGTLNLYSQTLSQAVVAINATTMAVVDHWQLPFEAAVSDFRLGDDSDAHDRRER